MKFIWIIALLVCTFVLEVAFACRYFYMPFSILFTLYLTVQMGWKLAVAPVLILSFLLDCAFGGEWPWGMFFNVLVGIPVSMAWMKNGDCMEKILQAVPVALMTAVFVGGRLVIELFNGGFSWAILVHFGIYLFCSVVTMAIAAPIYISFFDHHASRRGITRFTAIQKRTGLSNVHR